MLAALRSLFVVALLALVGAGSAVACDHAASHHASVANAEVTTIAPQVVMNAVVPAHHHPTSGTPCIGSGSCGLCGATTSAPILMARHAAIPLMRLASANDHPPAAAAGRPPTPPPRG